MAVDEANLSRCEQCGAPLDTVASVSGCFNCLLLGGPDEVVNSVAENRHFQHYDVSVLADKITPWELARDTKARERFRREARAAAQLRHPNVATVFHFGETPAGQCFYAMELVEGETLEARIRRDGPLPVSGVLDIAEQVARALAAAERHGLIHRDLKPSNIMVIANDADTPDATTVKVIDFGLAKAVAATDQFSDQPHTSFSGTPGFASPEQLRGDLANAAVDIRSDIYSLGVTLTGVSRQMARTWWNTF